MLVSVSFFLTLVPMLWLIPLFTLPDTGFKLLEVRNHTVVCQCFPDIPNTVPGIWWGVGGNSASGL